MHRYNDSDRSTEVKPFAVKLVEAFEKVTTA